MTIRWQDLDNYLDQLPILVRLARDRRGLSLDRTAAQIGISRSSLVRTCAGRGGDPRLSTLIMIMAWLDGDTDGTGALTERREPVLRTRRTRPTHG